MNLKKYIPRIDNSLTNIKNSTFKTFTEFRKTRKYEHSLECDVILIYPNSLAEKYKGLTDESNSLLVIPLLLRVYQNLHPVFIEGVKTFFVSSQYHATIDIEKVLSFSHAINENFKVDIKLTEKLRRFLKLKWEYNNDVISIELKNVNSTIDFSLFNNNFSSDFSGQAYKIIQTKSLAFLEETSKRVFILSCVVTGLIGICIGAFFMAIASILIFLVLK